MKEIKSENPSVNQRVQRTYVRPSIEVVGKMSLELLLGSNPEVKTQATLDGWMDESNDAWDGSGSDGSTIDGWMDEGKSAWE